MPVGPRLMPTSPSIPLDALVVSDAPAEDPVPPPTSLDALNVASELRQRRRGSSMLPPIAGLADSLPTTTTDAVPSKPVPSTRFDSEAAEMALAKLEGRTMAISDADVSVSRLIDGDGEEQGDPNDDRGSDTPHVEASEPSIRGYCPRPLLLPAYSNSHRSSTTSSRPMPTSRRTNSTSTTATEANDLRRTSTSSQKVHFSDSSPSKRRYSAPRFSPSKASPYNIYQVRRMNQQIQEDAQRAERNRRKREKELEMAEEEDDAWTLIESEDGRPDEQEEWERKKANRRSVVGEALADMDGDPAVIWRASLDVGRRIGTGRRAYGKRYALRAPPAASGNRLESVSEDDAGASYSTTDSTSSTAALDKYFPSSGHANITGSSVSNSRALTKSASSHSTVSHATSSSSSRRDALVASNAGLQGLLKRIYTAWRGWSPRQKARALFSYGVAGGIIASLITAAIRAQVCLASSGRQRRRPRAHVSVSQLGLANNFSPVTIALFPTLAMGGSGPTARGLDRNPGLFFGVGLFFRGVSPSLSCSSRSSR